MATNEFTVGSGQSNPRFTPIEEMGYEEAKAELIEVVKILELGQMNLDESLLYWERGEELAKRCEDFLEGARKRVEKVTSSGNNEDTAEAEGESQ